MVTKNNPLYYGLPIDESAFHDIKPLEERTNYDEIDDTDCFRGERNYEQAAEQEANRGVPGPLDGEALFV